MADKLKLVVAVLIVGIGVGAFYYFGDKPDLVRVLAVLAACGVATAVALQTAQGRTAWEFAKGARAELRKVVWPSNKETAQVTLVVIVMVILVAAFIWSVDWVLHKAVTLLTGQGS